MAVRKREWKTAEGEVRTAWIADYIDQNGDRHIQTFKLQKDAKAYSQQVGVDVRAGILHRRSRSPLRRQRATGSMR
jgi:integrase